MSGASTTPETVREPPEPSVEPRTASALVLLAPGFLLLACAVVLGPFEGGYGRTVWSPVSLFLLALLTLVLVIAAPSRSDRSRPVELALGLFVAYTLFSYLSILWADVPGDAWEGANRTALYCIGFALVALRPWPAKATRWALVLVVGAMTLVAIGVLIGTAARDNPAELFVIGRLSEPVGYANALAALWLLAFWPALHLTVDRDLAWPLRALALSCATVLLTTSLLSQSRGAALAFGVTAIVFVLVHPRRWVVLAALAVPAGAVLLGWDTLTEVRRVADSAALDEGLADARRTIALSAGLGLALGVLAIFGARTLLRDRGLSAAQRRTADRAFFATAGAVALAGLVTLAMSGGWLQDRWDSFKQVDDFSADSSDNRFLGGLGSGRYDFYRVALNEFRDHPVVGIGAENFAVPYLEHRRTFEAPRYVHSQPFAILAQLGLVGALLFAGFLVALGAAILRARTGGGVGEAGLATAGLASGVYWLAHGSVDWLWEYPALSLLALGLLATAARTGLRSPTPATGSGRLALTSVPARIAVAAGLLVLAISLALPGVSARYESSAGEVRSSDPAAALSRLDRAATLDPLSADPLISRAVLARRVGRADITRRSLVDAIEREPRNWFAHLELALLEQQQRHWTAAEAELRRARELNPRQEVLPEVARFVAARRRIDPNQVERALSGQLSTRLRPFDSE